MREERYVYTDEMSPRQFLVFLAVSILSVDLAPAQVLSATDDGLVVEITHVERPVKTRGIGVRARQLKVTVRGRVTADGALPSLAANGRRIATDPDGGFRLMVAESAFRAGIGLRASMPDGRQVTLTVSPSTAGAYGPITEQGEPPVVAGRFFALVIGIDRYTGSWPALDNAANDARAVAELLETDYGFDKVITLYDQEATRAAIIRRAEWLVSQVRPEDSVVIYYSGHGQLKEEFRLGYWVPVDATSNTIADFIPNTDVQRWLQGIPAKHVLLVADACFAGDIFEQQSGSIADAGPPAGTADYFRFLHETRSRWAITSGGVEKVLDGGRGDGHSVFASFLLEYLRENRDEYLDAKALFTAIKDDVVEASGNRQTPQMEPIYSDDHEGGQFVFRIGGSEVMGDPIPDPPPVPATITFVSTSSVTGSVSGPGGMKTFALSPGKRVDLAVDPGLNRVRAAGRALSAGFEQDLELTSGDHAVVVIESSRVAVAETGHLVLGVYPRGSIFVDGKPVAPGPTELAPGIHEVRFTHPVYGSETMPLRVESGRSVPYTFYWEREVAMQTVTFAGATPWATITRDGRPSEETTPFVLRLGPGRHRLGVVRSGYDVVTEAREINVRPGFDRKAAAMVFQIEKEEER